MATIPGMPENGLSTFSNALPPVSPYQDQHRTNLIFHYPKEIWNNEANYGFTYGSGAVAGLNTVNLGLMSTVTLATIKAAIETALQTVLANIQQIGSYSPQFMGNAYYAYELTLLTGFYYVTKIGLFDVCCVNWIGMNSVSGPVSNPVRFFMVQPMQDSTDTITYFNGTCIQWGFHPPLLGQFI